MGKGRISAHNHSTSQFKILFFSDSLIFRDWGALEIEDIILDCLKNWMLSWEFVDVVVNQDVDEDVSDDADGNEDLDEEDWLSQLCLFIWLVLFDWNEYVTKQSRHETNLSNQNNWRSMTSRYYHFLMFPIKLDQFV